MNFIKNRKTESQQWWYIVRHVGEEKYLLKSEIRTLSNNDWSIRREWTNSPEEAMWFPTGWHADEYIAITFTEKEQESLSVVLSE